MKKFMKMCGIDFLVSLISFFISAHFWFDYHLDIFFDEKSGIFGVSSCLTWIFFGSALAGLSKWIKHRKSSVAADDNK